MVDYKESPYELEENYGVGNSSNLAFTLRSLKEEIKSCKEYNDIIILAQEKLVEVNMVIIYIFSDLQ